MGFFGDVFSGIGGFLTDVGGGIGSFVSDIFGQPTQTFRESGQAGPPPPLSFGERVGGFAENVAGQLFEAAVPFLFPSRDPKVLCIVGPCPQFTPFPSGPGGARLPAGSTQNVIPSIPQSPGTLGRIPIGPRVGAAQPLGLATGGVRPLSGEFQTISGGGSVMAAALALPGGAAILRQLPGIIGGALGGALFGGGGGGAVDLPFGGQFFTPTMQGVRARALVRITNPATGSDVWFRNVGRPILFAGDFATVKRVRKVAALARRRSGGR